jgi:DNA-binding GntR family transcriptional regulator
VRGAIARLSQEGLVVNFPYRGAFVRRYSAQELDGLYQVRATLEALAARRAAARLSPELLTTIRASLEECAQALDARDLGAYGQADDRFHRALAEASGNPILVEMLDSLRLRIQVMRDSANHDPDLRDRSAHERPLILDALERRDGEAAARLLEAHVDSDRQAVLRQLTAAEK